MGRDRAGNIGELRGKRRPVPHVAELQLGVGYLTALAPRSRWIWSLASAAYCRRSQAAAGRTYIRYDFHVIPGGRTRCTSSSGTIPPTDQFDAVVAQYNVSPKLGTSGNRLSKRYKPAALTVLRATGKAWFKFVVTDHETDLAEVDHIVADVAVPAGRVMVMPEAPTGRRTSRRPGRWPTPPWHADTA